MSEETKFELPENSNAAAEKAPVLGENPAARPEVAQSAPKVNLDLSAAPKVEAPSFSLPKTSAAAAPVKFSTSADKIRPSFDANLADKKTVNPLLVVVDFLAFAAVVAFSVLTVVQQ